MLIEELSECLYEDLNGLVIATAHSSRGILVTLEFDDWQNQNHRRQVLFACTDVKESTLTVGGVGSVMFVSEHPVLYEHNSAHSELMFSSPPANPFEVMGRLLEAHDQFYGHWRNLSEHLNASSAVLAGGYGLVARGPHIVMQKYAAVIDDLLKVNIVESYKPKMEFKALIFDSQFLVCSAVESMEI